MSIFAVSEMTNPVFSVWSKTGPTLLRFKGLLWQLFICCIAWWTALWSSCHPVFDAWRKASCFSWKSRLDQRWGSTRSTFESVRPRDAVVVSSYIEQHMVGLSDGLNKTIENRCLSLQRQNKCFGYPGRIPSWGQDHIATVPLKSCFRQLFICYTTFQMSCGKWWGTENGFL